MSENLLALLGGNFKRVSGEHHGPCWKCGGRDRMFVKEGRATCRQCQWSGDEIQLLRDRDGLSFTEAAAQAGREVQPFQKKQKLNRRTEPAMRASSPKEVDFDQAAWGAMAHKLMFRAMEMLVTHDDGKQAEAYMRGRGLSLSTLCTAFIGYIPHSFETVWGGLKVKVEKGISIPWFDEKQRVHKINVRTDNPDMRYKMITGSVNGAYMSYRVRPGDIVVLVEGEIDALSIASATNFRVCGVATGSTMGGRLLSVVAKLALARRVLVAFDQDENNAGENAAQWWMQALPNAKRHLPTRHDVNDMLRIDGPESVQQWIVDGMKDFRPARPVASAPAAPKPAATPAPKVKAAEPPRPAQAVSLPGIGFSRAYHKEGM